MSITLNSSSLFNALEYTFSNYSVAVGSSPRIYYAALMGGAMPVDPTVTYGVTQLTQRISFDASRWLPASGGVSVLANPVAFVIATSGTVNFIRLYAYDIVTSGVIDISLGLVTSGSSGIVDTLSAVQGNNVILTDLRASVNVIGDISVGIVIANAFLSSLGISQVDYTLLGAATTSKYYYSGTTYYGATVNVYLYDGAIPASADYAPTGTLLWQKTLPDTTHLFSHSGLGMSLYTTLTANAVDSGTPTYVRIVKLTHTSLGVLYPETVFQVPVGPPINGCTTLPTTFVSGQPATIQTMTIKLQL
jgi:hypothetical protein